MDDATYDLALSRLEDLHKLCASDDLSLIALQQKINILDESDLQNISRLLYDMEGSKYDMDEVFPLIHTTCKNKNVTLEIVKYLIHTFPDPKGEWSTYKFCPHYETEACLLHIACSNEHCPDSVIEYLMNKVSSALEQLCTIDEGIHPDHPDFYIEGLPLHYYLSRDKNVDFDTVKMLVEAYPQSLMTFDENYPCYPIHLASNGNNLEIIEYFLELEPTSISLVNGDGKTLLHIACYNEHLTLEIYQFIFNKWPEAIRMRDDIGSLPIHALSMTYTLDEDASIDILQSMLDIDPTFARDRDSFGGYRPIDWAVRGRPFDFCKVLIDLYPESLRDCRPIHEACYAGNRDDSVDTIQYMLELYPESINTRNRNGQLPIHIAAQSGKSKIIELVLKHDPDAASRKTELPHEPSELPLHLACKSDNFGVAHIMSVQALYDAYPEAIFVKDGDGRTPLDVTRKCYISNRGSKWQPILRFLEEQLVYDQKAKDTTAMMAPDQNGWLLFHRALQDKAPLGTIKLLVGEAPAIVQTADNQFAFPLHIACEFSSVKVVQYLAGKSSDHILGHLDANKNSILHYACRGGNLGVVKYLLKNHAPLVSSAEINGNGELPIHLLCEAGKDKVDSEDRSDAEYIEVIWRMLLANPGTVVTMGG